MHMDDDEDGASEPTGVLSEARAVSRGTKRKAESPPDEPDAVVEDVHHKTKLATVESGLSTRGLGGDTGTAPRRRVPTPPHDEAVLRQAWNDVHDRYAPDGWRRRESESDAIDAVLQLWALYAEARQRWMNEFGVIRPIVFVYAVAAAVLTNGLTIDGVFHTAALTRAFDFPTKKNERSLAVKLSVKDHTDRRTVVSATIAWGSLRKTAERVGEALLRLQADATFMCTYRPPRTR